MSRSIGDKDVGEYIVPVPHVKQVKVGITIWKKAVFFFPVLCDIHCSIFVTSLHDNVHGLTSFDVQYLFYIIRAFMIAMHFIAF